MSGFLDHFFHEYWHASEMRRMGDAMYRQRVANRNSRIRSNDRIQELEDDLGRVALLVRSLADACVKKGVLTHNEIAEMMHKADVFDGVPDGKLNPKALRPPQER